MSAADALANSISSTCNHPSPTRYLQRKPSSWTVAVAPRICDISAAVMKEQGCSTDGPPATGALLAGMEATGGGVEPTAWVVAGAPPPPPPEEPHAVAVSRIATSDRARRCVTNWDLPGSAR